MIIEQVNMWLKPHGILQSFDCYYNFRSKNSTTKPASHWSKPPKPYTPRFFSQRVCLPLKNWWNGWDWKDDLASFLLAHCLYFYRAELLNFRGVTKKWQHTAKQTIPAGLVFLHLKSSWNEVIIRHCSALPWISACSDCLCEQG